MTGALDPQRAVEYLSLLSPDLEAVAVLDSEGKLLAGSPTDGHAGTEVSASSRGCTITARVGQHAQLALLKHDLDKALQSMV